MVVTPHEQVDIWQLEVGCEVSKHVYQIAGQPVVLPGLSKKRVERDMCATELNQRQSRHAPVLQDRLPCIWWLGSQHALQTQTICRADSGQTVLRAHQTICAHISLHQTATAVSVDVMS